MPDDLPPEAPVKVLFICSRNKIRSLTAEELCRGLPGLQARSAGTQAGARIKVTAGHLGWADIVFAMEKSHVRLLRERFPEECDEKEIVCLNIPDEYVYQEPALVDELRMKLSEWISWEPESEAPAA